MGISGLLQYLKDYLVSTNIRMYSGQIAAVDISCWIHQGAYYADFSCGAEGVVQKIINYITKRIRMLVELNIEPIIVFDGANISAKQRILDERAKNRFNSREKSLHLMMEGRSEEANKKFGQSFTITRYLVSRILKVIKGNWWKYVIAPYEADPQLAYLYKSGKVSIVITEDSDLIPYGVSKILYKMDNKGDGYELDMSKLYSSQARNWESTLISKLFTENSLNKITSILTINNSEWIDWDKLKSDQDCQLSNEAWMKFNSKSENCGPLFNKDSFLSIWILAGWDYLAPIKGIGFKTAHKLIEEHGTIDNALKVICKTSKYIVPKDYIEGFNRAYLTFLFQVVYDPDLK